MASTFAALATKALYRLNDSAQKCWTAAEIAGYIARGAQQFAEETRCAYGISELRLLTNVSVYDLPPRIMTIERVSWDNKDLAPLYTTDLESSYPNFETDTGQPLAYVLDKDGFRKIRILNLPDAESATIPIMIEGIETGAVFSSPTVGTVNLSGRQERYCIDFAMAIALDREGPGQDLGLADHYKGRFARGTGRAKIHMTHLESNQTRAIGVGALGTGLSEGYGDTLYPRLPFNYVVIDPRGRRGRRGRMS